MENYSAQKMQNDDQSTNDADNQSVQEGQKDENPPSPFVISTVPSWEDIVNVKGGVKLPE
jgi:hypothetical protein